MLLHFSQQFIRSITLLCFIFGSITPTFATIPIISANAASYHAVVSQQSQSEILICTGQGLKLVRLADVQNGTEFPDAPIQHDCSLCFAVLHKKALHPPLICSVSQQQQHILYHKYITNSVCIAEIQFLSGNAKGREPPFLNVTSIIKI